jgi:hypothetical protein
MKKTIGILMMMSLFFISCDEKFAEGAFTFYEIEEPENEIDLPDFPEIGKKGVGITFKNPDFSYKVSDLKVHWHYSWGSSPSILEPANVDYVPMIWGKGGIDEAKVSELVSLREQGKIRYLLGFNEPDGADQANMTVDEAVERWPLLEAVGVPLGSPGCVNPTGTWMKDFMQRANNEGLRVDFVCVHWYGGANAASLVSKLEEVYELYGKPIWITEFAPADWQAGTVEENRHSPAAVLQFAQTVLPQLEEMSYLQRYAWFPFSQNAPQGTSSALFDPDGNLTALGEFYADFEPNTYIGPGIDPPPPPEDTTAVFRDNFESYDVGSSLSSAGYIIWEGTATVGTGDAFEGDKFGQSDVSKNNFAIRRPVTLEAGKTYTIEVATRMQDGAKHVLQVHPKAAYEAAWVECLNANWENHTTQITVTEGNEEVIIALYRWPLKQMSFDNIVIKEVKE